MSTSLGAPGLAGIVVACVVAGATVGGLAARSRTKEELKFYEDREEDTVLAPPEQIEASIHQAFEGAEKAVLGAMQGVTKEEDMTEYQKEIRDAFHSLSDAYENFKNPVTEEEVEDTVDEAAAAAEVGAQNVEASAEGATAHAAA